MSIHAHRLMRRHCFQVLLMGLEPTEVLQVASCLEEHGLAMAIHTISRIKTRKEIISKRSIPKQWDVTTSYLIGNVNQSVAKGGEKNS